MTGGSKLPFPVGKGRLAGGNIWENCPVVDVVLYIEPKLPEDVDDNEDGNDGGGGVNGGITTPPAGAGKGPPFPPFPNVRRDGMLGGTGRESEGGRSAGARGTSGGGKLTLPCGPGFFVKPPNTSRSEPPLLSSI